MNVNPVNALQMDSPVLDGTQSHADNTAKAPDSVDSYKTLNFKGKVREGFWAKLSRRFSSIFNPSQEMFKLSPRSYKERKQGVWPWLAGIGALIVGIGTGAALHKNWGRFLGKEAKSAASTSHSELEAQASAHSLPDPEKADLQQRYAALAQEKEAEKEARIEAEREKRDLEAVQAQLQRDNRATNRELVARRTQVEQLKKQAEGQAKQLEETKIALEKTQAAEQRFKAQAEEGQRNLVQQQTELEGLERGLELEKTQHAAMQSEANAAKTKIAELKRAQQSSEEVRNELQEKSSILL